MSEEQVLKTGTQGKKKVPKLKTRHYYTDYVNHAIRFYLSTPDTLKMAGKRKADMENWIAVQTVFHFLSDEQKQVLTEIYTASYRLPEGVRMYCQKTGADEQEVWVMITKFNTAIAKRRGLI